MAKAWRIGWNALMVLFAAGIAGRPVLAQEDASFAGFQFNRSLPGARSLGMGGAFVAIADDATAAYSNPAGLTILRHPEVSLEGRQWNNASIFTAGGNATTSSLFRPQDFSFGESRSYTGGISFLSYVQASEDGRWAVGLYRHQLVDYRSRFSSLGVQKNATDTFGPANFSTDLRIANYGASSSFRVRPDLRLGVGVSYFTFDLKSVQDIIKQQQPETIAGKQGHDHDFSFNAGLLWDVSLAWTLGAAYRRGPKFKMNECFPFDDHRCFAGEPPVGVMAGGFDQINDFKVPDQWALGLDFRPSDEIKVLVEYDRVQYSALLQGNRFGSFLVVANGQSQVFKGTFSLADANEVRLGSEYTFVRKTGDTVSLRLGAWYDPDHTIVFSVRPLPNLSDGLRFRAAFFQPTGKDQVHVTGGIGGRAGRYEVNAGLDVASRTRTFALSTVVRVD